ncbi:glycoside hydrolase superfamily [Aspergillus pseudoustus]|uniref:Glycoside hydrolase superfamily n=1 Tax=Aspergillus pseudoustus TaxID=1810923 RepID=A0ABR4KCC7_9EURO
MSSITDSPAQRSASYPRPDFLRKELNWTSLNGPWSFLFDDSNAGLGKKWQETGLPESADSHRITTIQVPYAFQTRASGLDLREAHEFLWYERSIRDIRTDSERSAGNRLVLRFGAVDYECSVWVNGKLYTEHRGGYIPFDVDITDAFSGSEAGEKRVTVRVRDSPTDLTQPRGKQYWGPEPESIFYHPTSGIWQNVWLESVPRIRIGDWTAGTVLNGDDIGEGKVRGRVLLQGYYKSDTALVVKTVVSLAGEIVGQSTAQVAADEESVAIDVDVRVAEGDVFKVRSRLPYTQQDVWYNGIALWAPEHPVLYDVAISLEDVTGVVVDQVHTTVGMRSVTWENGDGTFRLNGKPYFQILVLDQGYWPDTGLTPPSGDALKADIELSKKMGFNGCRKHQKVEDPIFLYWADRLGYLVWGEIGNAYEFSDEYVERFNDEWTQIVKRDRHHPSVVVWTPVNESWGYKDLKGSVEQRNHIRLIYTLTKSLDESRPINDNCGWEHVSTDLTTYHDYSDSAELSKICSKMEGGILSRKLNGEMFVEPIRDGAKNVVDAGAKHTPGAPVICSEFGGVNIAPAKETPGSGKDWGYTTAADPNDLLARLEKLVMAVVKGGHTCGIVYTQLTDIEQEVNGLYSYDRREKVPADRVRAIMETAQQYYYKQVLQDKHHIRTALKRAAHRLFQ